MVYVLGPRTLVASRETQIDGSLVLGGYNKAKVITNNNMTETFNYTQCPTSLLTSLTDVILNFRNGTNTSLWTNSTLLVTAVCIWPSRPMLLYLQLEQLQTFMALTGGAFENLTRTYEIEYYTMVYKNDKEVYV